MGNVEVHVANEVLEARALNRPFTLVFFFFFNGVKTSDTCFCISHLYFSSSSS